MEKKTVAIRFNEILKEEMGKAFALKPLPLDPDFALKHASSEDKNVNIKNEILACPKTGGIRMGAMDFAGSMMVQFGSIQPGNDYDFPVLGFTFAFASKFLIAVLDLHPVAKDKEYIEKYLAPLKSIAEKYAWIPKTEGGRSEVHDWAKKYDSGYALYRWCDPQYLPQIEDAFRDYLQVFCACITKAEPLTDPAMRARREQYLVEYRDDYIAYDPGSAPLQHHFGEEWGERYLREFLFGA
jgi:15,16-dihydrobiliverdin:ferredoxin oxidoreductase